jgi:ribosomal-protein-serine acetyltransferase
MFSWRIDEQIELRMLEPHHSSELFSLADRNRKHLVTWLPWLRKTHRVEDTERFIRSTLEQYAAGDGFHAGIWHEEELCGAIGLHRIDWTNRNVSLGYWIAEPKQGRGIMTKATAAVVEHCFRDLGLHRVEIRCGAENYRSQAIPERLGFHREGVVRGAQLIGERWIDLVVYGRLEGDRQERP